MALDDTFTIKHIQKVIPNRTTLSIHSSLVECKFLDRTVLKMFRLRCESCLAMSVIFDVTCSGRLFIVYVV